MLSLDLESSTWSIYNCFGEKPTPRTQHAACIWDDVMIMHGGEGSTEEIQAALNQQENLGARQLGTGICPGDAIVVGKLRPHSKVRDHI